MQNRPIHEIARDIRKHWPNVYFGAKPYLDAMSSLTNVTDRYGFDTAESMIRYFLGNAQTWKGDKAKEIKAELKQLIK